MMMDSQFFDSLSDLSDSSISDGTDIREFADDFDSFNKFNGVVISREIAEAVDFSNPNNFEVNKKRRISDDNSSDGGVEKFQLLDILDPIFDAFNAGDFENVLKCMEAVCKDDLIYHCVVNGFSLYGIKEFMVFWAIVHEIYPDAMCKVLERRLRTETIPKVNGSINSKQNKYVVEIVYKFTGTNISSRPSFEIFREATAKYPLPDVMTIEDISLYATRHTCLVPPPNEETTCCILYETTLTCNDNFKMERWDCEFIAANFSSTRS